VCSGDVKTRQPLGKNTGALGTETTEPFSHGVSEESVLGWALFVPVSESDQNLPSVSLSVHDA
jgi:hypothetical protein